MLVYGCLTCGGSEDPMRTFSALYIDRQNDKAEFSWLCRECVERFLQEEPDRFGRFHDGDIMRYNAELRTLYLQGRMTWTGDRPAGLVRA